MALIWHIYGRNNSCKCRDNRLSPVIQIENRFDDSMIKTVANIDSSCDPVLSVSESAIDTTMASVVILW